MVNSPETYLTQNLAADATIIYVADSSVFGSLPNLAVIGTDQNAETILIKSKRSSDGGLEVQRALEGPAKRWEKTTAIARNFTNYDYNQVKSNIEKLNSSKQENLTAGSNIKITNGRISATDTKYNDTQIKKDIAELQNSQLLKASQTEAESGVDNTKYMTPQATKQAIEKLSPKQDLSGYAMKTDIKTKLSDLIDDSTHRVVTDKEKSAWNTVSDKVDKINGKGLSTNDYTDSAKQKVDEIPSNPKYTDTTYSNATTSSAGLMSAADKVKLNGLGESSDLKVEVTKGDGLTFYKYGKIVVMEIFFQISQSLTSRPSNKKSVPDNLKPSKSTYGHAMLLDGSGGYNVYKTMTLVQMYGGYSSGFVVDSKFTSSYMGMYCVGTMVYTID
ncbi:MAG: hypothetical protein ACLUJH_00860 [Peptoniphilus sp.]